ncbi:ribulose bisphosphate carboxylase small subunit [Thiococcus pfennigii]|uniref:ribulose bisphosphate carboxylase small subunit n=1 Tax=Thiococcus pfennigii TaxID=1057 RepID=UPI0019047A24|nr:ribulose bisphosphate carboxylase small subunit [Thiococcus pfennigii]
MPPQLGECIRKGCFVCIEHTAAMRLGCTHWEQWGDIRRYDGDVRALDREIETCKESHGDHHIRLNVEDLGFHSRMTLFVYNPSRPALHAA